MVSRRVRREFGPRLDISPEEAEELDEEETEEALEEEETTSIEDLTSKADPQEFDRTFTDADAQLAIEGVFDPVAGRKQVLPRVAYTINYNFVWNPDRGRWEPDEGNESGGGGLGTPVAEDTVTLSAGSGTLISSGLTDPDLGGDVLLTAAALAEPKPVNDSVAFIQVHRSLTSLEVGALPLWDEVGGEYTLWVYNEENNEHTISAKMWRV